MTVAGGGTEQAQRISVLVVDDDPDVAALVATYLQRADPRFSVTTETNPTAGLEAVRSDGYDCVVSDYHMPEMDGLSLLDRVDEVAPDVERVLHSSDDDQALKNAARDADVDYVYKRLTDEQYEQMAASIRERVWS